MEKRKQIKTSHSAEAKKEEILNLCYKRLRELVPECVNEVTLLKCIEILEKQQPIENSEEKLRTITDTLERLALLRKP